MSVLNELLKSFGLTMTATLIIAAIFAIVIVFWLFMARDDPLAGGHRWMDI